MKKGGKGGSKMFQGSINVGKGGSASVKKGGKK